MSECESCKKSTQPFAVVPLPCLDPAQVLCESTIDLECVEYTGPSKPCLEIQTGMSAAQVLEKLAAASNNCNCTVNSTLTFSGFPCDTAGIKLEYSNYEFVPEWSYKNKVTNTYEVLNPVLLNLSSDDQNYIQLLPISVLFTINAEDFKVTLTKPGCAPVVKNITVGSDCLPDEVCASIDDAIVKNPLTGEPIYYNLQTSSLTLESASALLCDILPNMTKADCKSLFPDFNAPGGTITYEQKFNDAYDAFIMWEDKYIYAIMKDNPNDLALAGPQVLPPRPHISDFYNHGKERAVNPNFNWIKIPLTQCACGLDTTNIKVYVKYLPHVTNFSQLPSSAQLGNVCYVSSEDMYYAFNPETNTWIDPLLFTTYFGKPFLAATDVNTGAGLESFDECISSSMARIVARKKALNEMLLARRPHFLSQIFIAHRAYDLGVRNIPLNGAPFGPTPVLTNGSSFTSCNCDCCFE
jgi:hypothetical protein